MATTADELVHRSRLRRNLPDPPVRRSLRERARLTQLDVAEALGVTRTAVSRWEGGSRTPRGATGEAYADLLNRLFLELA